MALMRLRAWPSSRKPFPAGVGALREPEKYRSYGLSIPNGMLLYGPRGAEKHSFRNALRRKQGWSLQNRAVRFEHLCARESEKIGKLFTRLDSSLLAFCSLTIGVSNREGTGVNPSAASEVNEFLAQMSNCSEAGVFIMGA